MKTNLAAAACILISSLVECLRIDDTLLMPKPTRYPTGRLVSVGSLGEGVVIEPISPNRDPEERTNIQKDVNSLAALTASSEIIIMRLKSFINETSFDTVALESQSSDIRKQLTQISSEVRRIINCKGPPQQLVFAQYMFREMVESFRKLGKYKAVEVSEAVQVPGHLAIFEIIELNVRALAMNNYHGVLDLQIGDYERKLSEFQRQLRFWKEEFKEVGDKVDPQLWPVYYGVVSQAEATLELLESYIPGRK